MKYNHTICIQYHRYVVFICEGPITRSQCLVQVTITYICQLARLPWDGFAPFLHILMLDFFTRKAVVRINQDWSLKLLVSSSYELSNFGVLHAVGPFLKSTQFYYRTTTIYSNFLTLRTLRVWSEGRFSIGLPGHHTGTITEGHCRQCSLSSHQNSQGHTGGWTLLYKGRSTPVDLRASKVIAQARNLCMPA